MIGAAVTNVHENHRQSFLLQKMFLDLLYRVYKIRLRVLYVFTCATVMGKRNIEAKTIGQTGQTGYCVVEWFGQLVVVTPCKAHLLLVLPAGFNNET